MARRHRANQAKQRVSRIPKAVKAGSEIPTDEVLAGKEQMEAFGVLLGRTLALQVMHMAAHIGTCSIRVVDTTTSIPAVDVGRRQK
jgi:hypothetical protein